MPKSWPRPAAFLLPLLLLKYLRGTTAITVESIEVLRVEIDTAGEFDGDDGDRFVESDEFIGIDPRDDGCEGRRCIGMLTRDGSLELNSRYGCTQPAFFDGGDSEGSTPGPNTCSLGYRLEDDAPITLAAMKIAFHPDSMTEIQVVLDGRALPPWTATPGSSELQEIPGVEGATVSFVTIYGILEPGDFFGVLEVEFFVEVDEVQALGVSAATRTTISATATSDTVSVMNTLDGDATDASSWTCSSGQACELTYDLGGVESLEQLRIAFSDTTDSGGEFNILTAGEFDSFSPVRTNLKAGSRPPSSDGLATFGGVRALARYVKVEVVPPSGGDVTINEVEFRVNEDAPTRPVPVKLWLKQTGKLPLGGHSSNSGSPSYDDRAASYGGCNSPGHLEGCQVIYVKDGDLTGDSRWSCGPLATPDFFTRGDRLPMCGVKFNLNIFRYVGQVRLVFQQKEEHHEVGIEALTKEGEWVTVVASAISSADPGKYQTFDIGVHTNAIRVTPKFQRYNQWVGFIEIVVFEHRKNAFTEGTVPVLRFVPRFEEASTMLFETTSRFKFDVPAAGDTAQLVTSFATISALRMRFPANRQFVFDVAIDDKDPERFTSAGGRNEWETFTLSAPGDSSRVDIAAVDGPVFPNKPKYPKLRVADLQVVGEVITTPGVFKMASTAISTWFSVPDIIADGTSDQQDVMTAICETKGAAFDGTDCVGELNDATVEINFWQGDYYLDGPIFLKSGVTLDGGFSDDSPRWPYLRLYDGPNTGNTAEEAVIVVDGATGTEVEGFAIGLKDDATGPIIPGTVGNLCVDIRNSKDVLIRRSFFETSRTGGARISDSSDVTVDHLWSGEYETGNFMEVSRLDGLFFEGFPTMAGLLIEDSTNLHFEGSDDLDFAFPAILAPPTGGSQTANVVITGTSSGVVFKAFSIGDGPEPRVVVESTAPVTLDTVEDYAALSGDCIVQVPEGATDDSLIQVGSERVLTRSGDCWVFN